MVLVKRFERLLSFFGDNATSSGRMRGQKVSEKNFSLTYNFLYRRFIFNFMPETRYIYKCTVAGRFAFRHIVFARVI